MQIGGEAHRILITGIFVDKKIPMLPVSAMHGMEVAGSGTKGRPCVGLVDDIELARFMVLTFLLVFDLGSSAKGTWLPHPYSLLCLRERFALGCINILLPSIVFAKVASSI